MLLETWSEDPAWLEGPVGEATAVVLNGHEMHIKQSSQ